jgi:isoprenylcysteine carboxyl methyltransferase (ICMT) family protein YpbQ
MIKAKPVIPKSCTSYVINLTAVVVYMLTIRYLRLNGVISFWGAVISIGTLAAAIVILEKIKKGKLQTLSSGVDFSKANKIEINRVLIKLWGLYVTIGLVAFLYWIFPEYHTGGYNDYFKLTYYLLPVVLIGGIPYFFILDKFMKDPCDGYWHAGMFFLGKWKLIDKWVLKNHFLGWLVKAFFLALMFPALMNNTGFLMGNTFAVAKTNFPSFYDYMYTLIFSIDLVFVCAGYLLTLKVFDSHIRTVEPSILGWIVALQCYQPFWNFSYQHYLNYDDNLFWGHLFASNHTLYSVYGTVILILLTIYTMASVAFGLRFSNLTNRGIITNGPYRWMKHPAYVSKNLAWWLISVPFLSQSGIPDAIRHSLLLLALNLIYYLRARTEERHLSLDAVYIQYGTSMNERGIFSGLYRVVPFLKYDVNQYIKDGKVRKMLF